VPTRASAAILVAIPPGCTVVTPIPRSASSARRTWLKPRSANFEAEYADWPGGEISP
jgi:hypothetical protein